MSRWGKDFLKGKKRTTLAWKCISIALAFVLVVTAFEKGMFQRVLVLAATESPEEDNEKVIEEEVDGTAGLLDDENGRISFWEWNKVTFDNWEDYLLDPDNFEYKDFGQGEVLVSRHLEKAQFQPCMFVHYSIKDGEPHGFISTYADDKHVYRGSSQGFPTEVGTVPDKIPVYMKDYLGNMDETKSVFLLQDADGSSVDSKYFNYVDDNDEKQVYHIDGIDYSKGKEGVSDGFTIFTPAY